MKLVVLSQAFRGMVPLLLTQAIVLFQDTSLVYVISLADFFRTATNIGDRDGTTVEMVLFAGACYSVICVVASAPRQKSSEKGRKMISIKNVLKWYGQFQVLTDCTTEVKKGEVVVMCSPSGSGKSTLIKTVNGLEPFQKGEISINGQSLTEKKTNLSKLRSKVGMVFQHSELFPHLTLTQIKVLGRSNDKATQKGLKLLDRVGMCSHSNKFPGQLSGGQQQHVAIARAVDGPDCHALRRTHVRARSGNDQ